MSYPARVEGVVNMIKLIRQLVNKNVYIVLSNMYQRRNTGGARGVTVIVVGIVHDDTSSNPGRDWLHFT